MGGGGPKQEQTSTVTTETNTTIRDIGLTGASAVDLAEVLQSGAIESEAIRATSLDNLVQQSGQSYQQLIGGANNLITTVAAASDNLIKTTGESSRDILAGTEKNVSTSSNMIKNAAMDAQNTIRTLADRATNEDSDIVKAAPYIAVVSIGLLAMAMKGK